MMRVHRSNLSGARSGARGLETSRRLGARAVLPGAFALVVLAACTSAVDEPVIESDSELRSDVPVAVPSGDCEAMQKDVCKRFDALRDACSPDNLGSDCSRVASCSCAYLCFGPSASAEEPCFTNCKTNRCSCIQHSRGDRQHPLRSFTAYREAKKRARAAGCTLTRCTEPCDAL